MKSPEGYEKDEICKYLDSIGAWYFKPYMGGFGKRGVPDIIACIGGEFWGIEVKREGKKPTALQELCLHKIGLAKGHAVAGTAANIIIYLKSYGH